MTPQLHPLPKHPEIWLPKFNPDDGLPTEEHLHKYILEINLNGVLEEDCVCRIFPYTFEGSIVSSYFSFLSRLITNILGTTIYLLLLCLGVKWLFNDVYHMYCKKSYIFHY